MRPKATSRILTANDLLSGLSVFFAAGGSWTNDCSAACVAHDDEGAALLEAAGKAALANNKVVGPYLVEVRLNHRGTPEPIHYRERMRVLAQPSFWPSSPSSRAAARPGRKEAEKEARHVSL